MRRKNVDGYYRPNWDDPRCPLCGHLGLTLTRVTELGIPTQNKTIVCRNGDCPLYQDPEALEDWVPEKLAGRARRAYHQKLKSYKRRQHLANKGVRRSLGQIARRAREKARA